ncbi:MAG: hypothetical protein NT015_06540 [Alphaproteobacteria bacterium]|nr:hypothetical protein [Alphaproteobacteria bacterium]
MKRFVFAAALLLAACGQPTSRETHEAYPVVEAPNYDTTIGPDGAAGITEPVEMNVASVRAAAPNYIVAEVDDQVDGQAFKAITLSAGDEEVFRVYPTADGRHVHSVVTRSTQAHSPVDEIVGRAKFAVAPPEQVTFCNAEFVDGAPGFACSTAEDGRFWRVYRLPDGAGAAETFDEIEPDLLHDATLVEMRWVAPRA